MSDDIIKNREIKGVAGNKTNTSLAVDCGFYPIVKFELSDKNSEGVNLMIFQIGDEYNEKKKSFIEEIEYPHLKKDEPYFIPYLSVKSSDQPRTIKLSCVTSEGTFDCIKKGKVQIKTPNSNTITGISISTESVDNVYVEDEFTIDIILSKDINIEKFEKFNCYPLIFTVVNEDNETEVGRLHLAVEPELKQYILVAGIDYPSIHNNYKLSGDYSVDVIRRKKEIITKCKNNEITIIYTVSLLKGTIEKTTIRNGKTLIDNIGKYIPITFDDNYKPTFPYFSFTKEGVIRKWDIYGIIENIGDENPNTVMEFGVYSHAYYDGPILVDSKSNDVSIDNDFRKNDPVSIEDSFAKAFNEKGKIFLWGCSFPKLLNLLFSKLRNNPKYKSSQINNNEIFSYASGHFYVGKDFSEDPQYLIKMINNYLSTNFKQEDKIELTFLQIKKIACINYLSTYASEMAKHFELTVIAALPATYANTSPNFHISDLTFANVKFYKNHLGIKLENNFGIYDVETINNLTLILNSKL